MDHTEVPTRADDDATAAAGERVPRSYSSPSPASSPVNRTPADSRPARPNPAWRHQRRQNALLPGESGSPRRRAPATGRALTVAPAQGLEEQVSLHADSRHGESRALRLRHVRGLSGRRAKDPPLLFWAASRDACVNPTICRPVFSTG